MLSILNLNFKAVVKIVPVAVSMAALMPLPDAGQSLTSFGISLANAASTGPSGLPLPRFVSLKAQRVNMRVGPGRDYRVEWMYTRRGLPLEILQEYDNWRKVRDSEGAEGWVLQTLLSGERTAIVTPWKKDEANALIDLKNSPENAARTIARIEPGAIIHVDECEKDWCSIKAGGISGYAFQNELWGVYPGEKVE